MSMDFQLMPQARELEEGLLGCMLIDNKQIQKVEPYLKSPNIFYHSRHQKVWKIMKQVYDNEGTVDALSVVHNFSQKDKDNGLTAYWLTGLSQDVASPASAVSYAKKLYEDWLYRETIKKTEKIKQKAYDGNASVYPLIGETYIHLGELLDLRPSEGFDMGESIENAMTEIREGGENMVKCGWDGIDKLSGGFTKGEVSIVGGRPGHGKTTFLINLASQLVKQGHKVLLFNRELPITEVVKKILCLESGKLSYKMVRNSQFSKSDLVELENVDKMVRELYSSEKFQMFDKIRDFEHSAVEVRKFNPDVVIDDYIQLIDPPSGVDQRRLQLEKICNDYKWLAKTQKCAVILASQLNRSIEYRGTKSVEPQLSDLAESGAIEQVAENVFFTHYPFKFHPDKNKNSPNKIKIIARKVRYGETGSVVLGYDGDKCKLYGSYKDFETSKS